MDLQVKRLVTAVTTCFLVFSLETGCTRLKPARTTAIYRPLVSIYPPKPLPKAALGGGATGNQPDRAIPWNYPPAIDPMLYCWVLQSSTNLVDWSDVASDCTTDPLRVYATNACMFFRLRGTR